MKNKKNVYGAPEADVISAESIDVITESPLDDPVGPWDEIED